MRAHDKGVPLFRVGPDTRQASSVCAVIPSSLVIYRSMFMKALRHCYYCVFCRLPPRYTFIPCRGERVKLCELMHDPMGVSRFGLDV